MVAVFTRVLVSYLNYKILLSIYGIDRSIRITMYVYGRIAEKLHSTTLPTKRTLFWTYQAEMGEPSIGMINGEELCDAELKAPSGEEKYAALCRFRMTVHRPRPTRTVRRHTIREHK